MTAPQQPLTEQELAELREALPVLRAIQTLIKAGTVDGVAQSALEQPQARRRKVSVCRDKPRRKPNAEDYADAARAIRKHGD